MADIASIQRIRWERFTADSHVEEADSSVIATAKGNDRTDDQETDHNGAINHTLKKRDDGGVDEDIIPSEFECVLCLRCDAGRLVRSSRVL